MAAVVVGMKKRQLKRHLKIWVSTLVPIPLRQGPTGNNDGGGKDKREMKVHLQRKKTGV
jgi:hypothetical protein